MEVQVIVLHSLLWLQYIDSDMVSVEKDKKGSCMIVSHIRAGYHECIWLTIPELKELRDKLNEMDLG